MRYSSDLVIAGQNPYTHSMLSAVDRYASVYELPNITHRADGSQVSNISYPALSFLVFVPQRLLGIPNINLTVVLFFILTLALLIRETPYWLFTVTVTVLFFNQYLVSNAVFGNIDFVWIFPLLLGMHFWHRGMLIQSTFAVGIAFAVKPIAWFIAPFTAVWLWRNPDQFNKTRTTAIALALGAGFAGFLIPNLPYIIEAPQAWTFDVFSAAGSRGPFETRGAGIAVFAYSNVIPIPIITFRLFLVGIIASSLTVYYLYFEELKWVAWVMPAFILWFNDRALFNYFITFIPIAYYAMMLNRDVVSARPLIPVNSMYKYALRAVTQFRESLRR
jgi:uncharacterized membrane protein